MILLTTLLTIVTVICLQYKKTILLRENKVYLIRHTLFTCPHFSIKIHVVKMDDPDELHNHPWNYTSIILWGGYYETTVRMTHQYNNRVDLRVVRNFHRPFSILRRQAHIPHKLSLKDGKTCVSLIFTGKKDKEWGYIKHEDNSCTIQSQLTQETVDKIQRSYWI